MHDNEAVLEAMYAGWRNQDIDAITDCFTEDSTYEDMAMGVTMHGREGVADFAKEVYKTMPDFDVRYTKRFATDSFGAGQWVIKATWNGEFEGVDCTGKKIEFTGLSYYHFDNGKIAAVQDCWDYVVMMKAFGTLSEDLKKLA